MNFLFPLSHRNTNFTTERGRALFVEWTGLVSIISPESFIISPRADYETHNQPYGSDYDCTQILRQILANAHLVLAKGWAGELTYIQE